MMQEVVDKESGAILFKKSEEMLTLERLIKLVESLEDRIRLLEEEIAELKKEEDS